MTSTEYREMRRRLLRERQLGLLAMDQLTDPALGVSAPSETRVPESSDPAPSSVAPLATVSSH